MDVALRPTLGQRSGERAAERIPEPTQLFDLDPGFQVVGQIAVVAFVELGVLVGVEAVPDALGAFQLDLSLVYFSDTWLLPQAVGGLLLGFGFIIGGYCPGTSMVGEVRACSRSLARSSCIAPA